jgi:poly-beta-1,6-N-acetyl-D-glucosamine synthase
MIIEFITYSLVFIVMYFQVFLLLNFFDTRKKMNGGNQDINEKDLPTVTVMVPCFNEEKTLAKTIESLLNLKYPKEKLSIFIIDDGSTDNTPEIMRNYKIGYPQIKTFGKENGGKWRALNYGLEKVTSEMVGCLDADSFVDQNALMEIVKKFQEDKEIMVVTPAMRIYRPDTIIRKIQSAEYDLGIFMAKIFSHLRATYVTPGPFSIFKTEVFKKIGKYRHAHNTEDLEIALRMQKAHMRIENVYTVGPATAYKLYKQRIRWTGGYMKNLVDYRKMMFGIKHKHLSFIVLPMTAVSILAALYFVVVLVLNLIKSIYSYLRNIQAINFDLTFSNINFDWFFFDVRGITLISLVLIGMMTLFIIMGRHITHNKKINLDLFLFIFLYSFISPFWLIKSLYSTIMWKDTKWR